MFNSRHFDVSYTLIFLFKNGKNTFYRDLTNIVVITLSPFKFLYLLHFISFIPFYVIGSKVYGFNGKSYCYTERQVLP